MLTYQIIVIILCFVLHYGSMYWVSRQFGNTVIAVCFQRIIGFILLMIPAMVFFDPSALGFENSDLPKMFTLIFVFTTLALLVNTFRRRTNKDLQTYPQIRVTVWTPQVVSINAITWTLYLLPYEFVFRGALLNDCLVTMQPWIAFSLNALIYSIAHAPQGPRETIVAFPFGILLCVISSATGNFWSAYLIHVALALSNDYFAVVKNPNMTFANRLTPSIWHSTKKTSRSSREAAPASEKQLPKSLHVKR